MQFTEYPADREDPLRDCGHPGLIESTPTRTHFPLFRRGPSGHFSNTPNPELHKPVHVLEVVIAAAYLSCM
jgi:hypothetical protein